MSIVLPTKAYVPENQDPRVLVLMSNTKVGKTEACTKLPNSLLIDLEDGSGFYNSAIEPLNLKKKSIESGVGMGSLLVQTADAIAAANRANGSPVYDFIVIDTITAIEEIARIKATIDYKNTLQGKNFVGKDVVKELPKGQGYSFLSAAFADLIKPYRGLPGKCLILLGHAKLSTIEKDIKEVQVNDIELTGKIKLQTIATADSIGYLYRNKKNLNQNILSFKTSENDLVCGSRSPHLRNKEFIFSTYDPKSNSLVAHWDLVFSALKSKSTKKMEEIVVEETATIPM